MPVAGHALELVGTSVIEQQARQPQPDWMVESRAAAAFLRSTTRDERQAQSRAIDLARAAQRVLAAPVVGRPLTRVTRWLLRKPN